MSKPLVIKASPSNKFVAVDINGYPYLVDDPYRARIWHEIDVPNMEQFFITFTQTTTYTQGQTWEAHELHCSTVAYLPMKRRIELLLRHERERKSLGSL